MTRTVPDKLDAETVKLAAGARDPVLRHPEGCVFCPAELLGVRRDRNGDPLCQTCPHLRDQP